MTGLIFILIVLLLTLILSFVAFCDYDDEKWASFFCAIISFLGIIAVLLLICEPKPIDVYRGKTTLEITYRDSIPIDSVVVWKNK